jgi:hypothetical protein
VVKFWHLATKEKKKGPVNGFKGFLFFGEKIVQNCHFSKEKINKFSNHHI